VVDDRVLGEPACRQDLPQRADDGLRRRDDLDLLVGAHAPIIAQPPRRRAPGAGPGAHAVRPVRAAGGSAVVRAVVAAVADVARRVVGAVTGVMGSVVAAAEVAAAIVGAAVVAAVAGGAGASVIVAAVVRDGVIGAVTGEGRRGRRAAERHDGDRGTRGETSCGLDAHCRTPSRWCPHCRPGLVPPSMGLWSWVLAGAAAPG
jgi:hypothetical protein